MGKYSELVHKLPEETSVMEELTDITDEFVESIKITHPQKYDKFIQKIKKLSNTGHFTEEDLEQVKESMDIHFPLDATTNYATETYEIDFDKENFNEYDFNFIINELYRNFNPVFQEDMSKYTELALSWLDYNNGKAYWYFCKLYK